MRIGLNRPPVALLGTRASARRSWKAAARKVGFEDVQVAVLDEDGSESLLIDQLICVCGWIVDIAEPLLAESLDKDGGDAVLLPGREGSVVVGGQSVPARVRYRVVSTQGQQGGGGDPIGAITDPPAVGIRAERVVRVVVGDSVLVTVGSYGGETV
jgi:hypothetical protein